MSQLRAEQVDALLELQQACRELETQAVIIGATAYRIWTGDLNRTTEDMDFAVALDLDEFPRLTEKLEAERWRSHPKIQHRWISRQGARVDLIPAGENARRRKQITWPGTVTTMSLVGFDHVFAEAVECTVASGVTARVVPLSVLVLLKMVAFLDMPQEREPDLLDIASVMAFYESEGERRFGEDVIASGVDYDSAGAYLLGLDLARLCTASDEVAAVERFLAQISDQDSAPHNLFVRRGQPRFDEEDETVRHQIAAIVSGFQKGRTDDRQKR